jgi:MFS transporter, FHS family, L-fucose permease
VFAQLFLETIYTFSAKKTMNTRKSYFISLLTIGALFFIFGFVTWLNGSLIPFLKIACELTTFQALLVTFAFYISYFVMALPSSFVLEKTGFQNGMALGLTIMALGSLVFVPAAYSRQYWVFLTGLFIQGTGLALLQTAVNPYVTVIGPEESAAKRISIMGICNKVAGVISPLVLGTIILKGASHIVETLKNSDENNKQLILNNLSQRLIVPYIIMAITLFFLALMIKFVNLPKIDTVHSEHPGTNEKKNILHFPHLVLGMLAIFFYVGAEVIAGDTIILYGQSQGIALDVARIFTSYTLTAMIIGYIIGIILIPRFLKQSVALSISAVLGIAFSVIALISSGFVSVLFIALLGMANAIMWPAIWPLSISGLGKFTEKGSALLIMGILGGATIPPLYGLLSQMHGWNNQRAYVILIPIYLYIFFFATKGHKFRSWVK